MNVNILQTIFKDGGITLNNDLTVKTDLKYVSSLKGFEFVEDLNTLTIKKFLEVIEEKRLKAIELNCLVGCWIDKEKIYIDLSHNFDNLNDCLEFGKENEQKAIFDGVKFESVTIQY